MLMLGAGLGPSSLPRGTRRRGRLNGSLFRSLAIVLLMACCASISGFSGSLYMKLTLGARYGELEEQLSSRRRELDSLKHQLQALQVERDGLSKRVEDAADDKRSVEKEKHMLENDNDRLKVETSRVKRQLDTLKHNSAEKEKQLQTARGQLVELEELRSKYLSGPVLRGDRFNAPVINAGGFLNGLEVKRDVHVGVQTAKREVGRVLDTIADPNTQDYADVVMKLPSTPSPGGASVGAREDGSANSGGGVDPISEHADPSSEHADPSSERKEVPSKPVPASNALAAAAAAAQRAKQAGFSQPVELVDPGFEDDAPDEPE